MSEENVTEGAAPEDASPGPQGTDEPTGASPNAESAEPETQGTPERYTFEVGGKQREYTRDELLALLPIAEQTRELTLGAHKQFREAAELRKKIDTWKSNKRALLEDPEFGEGLYMALVEDIQKEIAMQELTPEQKRIKELEEKLTLKEQIEKQLEEEKHKVEMTKAEEAFMTKFENEAIEALESIPLPRTPDTVADIAKQVWLATQAEYDLPTKQAAQLAYDEFRRKVRSSASLMSGKDLIDFYGEEIVDKIRKEDLARAKAHQPATSRAVSNGAPAPRKQERSWKSLRDL